MLEEADSIGIVDSTPVITRYGVERPRADCLVSQAFTKNAQGGRTTASPGWTAPVSPKDDGTAFLFYMPEPSKVKVILPSEP